MSRQMPYKDWLAATRELDGIRTRPDLLELPVLGSMLERTYQTLKLDGTPTIAALELEYIGAVARKYPGARDAMMSLSRRLLEYPTAETTPPA